MRRYSLAFAVLSPPRLPVCRPLLVTDRYSRLGLKSAAVFAASTQQLQPQLSRCVLTRGRPWLSKAARCPCRRAHRPRPRRRDHRHAHHRHRPQHDARAGDVHRRLFHERGHRLLEHAEPATLAPLVSRLPENQFDGSPCATARSASSSSMAPSLLLDKLDAKITSKPTGTFTRPAHSTSAARPSTST